MAEGLLVSSSRGNRTRLELLGLHQNLWVQTGGTRADSGLRPGGFIAFVPIPKVLDLTLGKSYRCLTRKTLKNSVDSNLAGRLTPNPPTDSGEEANFSDS